MTTLATVIATLGSVVGCASQTPEPAGTRAPPPGPAEGETGAVAFTDDRPGYRARIAVGAPGSTSLDDWTDVVVLDTSDRGRTACEVRVDEEVSLRSSAGFTVQVGQPCATQPLPVPDRHAGAYLLVMHRAGTESLPLVLEGSGDTRPVDIEMTSYARMDSREDCERARALLAAGDARERGEAEATARRWLEEELVRAQERADQACDEHRQAVEQCATRGTDADLERACGRSPEAPECDEAKQMAFERAACEANQRRAERSCQTSRLQMEELRRRAAQPDPNDAPSSADQAVCQRLE